MTKRKVRTRLPDAIVLTMIVAYSAFFSYLSIRCMESLVSGRYDLAIFDQVIWGTARGGFYWSTLMPDTPSLLGHHFSPILLSLVPLYWTWSDVRVLLIAQSIILALGAFPVYWLARERMGALIGIIFAAAYLLFPPLEAGNLADFHEVAFSVPLLALTFWFLLRRNYVAFSVSAFLAVQVKEEVSLLVMMLGIYAILSQRQWRLGLAWAASSAIFFFIVAYVVIPRIQGGDVHPFLSYFGAFGKTPFEIAWNVLTNPAHTLAQLGPNWSIQYLGELLDPFGLLAIFAPLEFLLSLPQLAINLLSNAVITHRLIGQYPLNLIPFVVMSSVIGASRIVTWLARIGLSKNWASGALSLVVLASALSAQRVHGLTPLSQVFTDYPITPHAQRLGKFISKIPRDASVWTQLNLLPFLSQRERLYTWGLENAEYIFIDAATAVNFDNANQMVRDALMQNYHILAAEDGYLLLQHGPGDKALPSQFHSFTLSKNPNIQHPMLAQFGNAIEFLGYDVQIREWEFNEEPELTLYLRALRKLDKDYWIKPYLIDAQGQVIGSSDLPQATAIWFPTSKWNPGEIVQFRANTFTWWTGSLENFSVALGILDGDDPWDASIRLVPQTIQSTETIELPADGTLLKLAAFSNDLLLRRQFIPQPHLYDLPSGTIKNDSRFGKTISLRGYRTEQTRDKDGKTLLRLTLYWQSSASLSTKYTVFVHVLNADGEMIAQHDGQPNHGNTPTTVWLPNEIIADAHEIVLPDGVSADKISIQVGMYDSTTGARLAMSDASDAVILGK